MKKTVMICVLLLAAGMLFADGAGIGDGSSNLGILIGRKTSEGGVALAENPFEGPLRFFLTVICGAVGGGLVLIKFSTEIFYAATQSSDDPNAYKKVITRLLLHLLIVALGAGGVYFVLGVAS